jgi:NhaP-type Na+/H+ or K+/H+ antiporter
MSLSPTLIVAIAMCAGVLSQALSHRMRIPGVVVLLFVGAILGPDVLGVVRPRLLGDGLKAVVGFSIAVILFEGGLILDIKRLKLQAVVIRRLVTIGALVTAIGAAIAVHTLADWGWRQSIIFGSLVVVTGPTVITPLLRRIRVVPSVHTILEAEGVFIDAVGAVLAVASLEIALNPSLVTVGEMAAYLGASLGIGATIGAAGGLLLYVVFRFYKNIPSNLHSVFALSVAVLVFEIGNHLMSESGLAAVLVCGAVVGNSDLRVIQKVAAFKEQLSVLLLSVLFVLLAADVRFDDVLALGPAVIGVVLLLMFVIRPLNVWICSFGLGVPRNEKLFVSWLAPRGIVAAAVASFVAVELEANGISGGRAIQALVFVVIAATVGLQGLSSGYVAKFLRVAEPGSRGYVILGANALARALAQCLRRGQKEVVLLDSDPKACRTAEEEGLRILYGDALRESALLFARVKYRLSCAALTTNEKVNYIFAEAVSIGHKGPKLLVAESHLQQSVTTDMLQRIDAGLLFGRSLDIALWVARFSRRDVHVSQWVWREGGETRALKPMHPAILPMVRWRGQDAELIDDATALASGDVVDFAVVISELSSAILWLEHHGFSVARPILPIRQAA